MSFKGQIEAECPGDCEPFETDVWSFIRGDLSPELRESILYRECNLLLCPQCGVAFMPEAAWIYYEPKLELLAFVFPENFRAKEQYWREKMHADFLQMKGALGKDLPVALEPEIFFGTEDIAVLLESEDYRGEEREVMEFLAGELGLSLYRVSAQHARRGGIPSSLPYAGKTATRESVIAGLEKLVAANDRLEAFSKFLNEFRGDPAAPLPPASTLGDKA